MPHFKLPDLGEGVTEAEVDRWLVKEGDEVGEDDLLVEVITDKATAEIPSPYAGVVSKIHVEAGQVVPVGTVLVTIGEADGVVPETVSATPSKAAAAAVRATPQIRKLARELGVDLDSVRGTGADGRILRTDVEAAARAVAPVTGGRREPFRGVRRRIAERMAESHRIVPPVTHVEECDVTDLHEARTAANDRGGAPRLTFLPFIVAAVVDGLKEHPAINATLDEVVGEIVYHDRYDIGVAVDTPSGLVVPVVRDADRKSLREIAADIEQLATGAREGTLTASELRGSTFTVTSPGPYGGLMATPLVFYPQSAILGVHRAIERPVVRDGQIVARLMMNLSITFDHRILDGVTAAKFCLGVVDRLEHPESFGEL